MERNKALMKGFTLIELLVVIFIISLLSGIFFANYRQGGKEMALQRAASKLAQDIRRAQEMAIAATECPSGTACAGQIPPRYGIEISKSHSNYYIIFADNNDNGKLESSDVKISTTTFEGGVTVNNIFYGEPPNSANSIWITFKPPDPEIQIRAPAAVNSSVGKIELKLAGQIKTIRVNTAGLIEIQ